VLGAALVVLSDRCPKHSFQARSAVSWQPMRSDEKKNAELIRIPSYLQYD
jgi:hypothetical protein